MTPVITEDLCKNLKINTKHVGLPLPDLEKLIKLREEEYKQERELKRQQSVQLKHTQIMSLFPDNPDLMTHFEPLRSTFCKIKTFKKFEDLKHFIHLIQQLPPVSTSSDQ